MPPAIESQAFGVVMFFTATVSCNTGAEKRLIIEHSDCIGVIHRADGKGNRRAVEILLYAGGAGRVDAVELQHRGVVGDRKCKNAVYAGGGYGDDVDCYSAAECWAPSPCSKNRLNASDLCAWQRQVLSGACRIHPSRR